MIALDAAQAWLLGHVAVLEAEPVALHEAAGRVLAVDLPAVAATGLVATIDGHAVRAAETEGASDYAPLPIGGGAVVSGALLPPGTDAVLPAHLHEGGMAFGAVPPGHAVRPAGEAGLPGGTLLRPPHLAQAARLGHETVPVTRRPRIGAATHPMLGALIAAEFGIVTDETPDLHLEIGAGGSWIPSHRGLALVPGETTVLGLVGATPAIRLPSDPLAYATVFALLVAPALRRMGRRPAPEPAMATLARKIASGLGMVDAVRVRLEGGRAIPLGPADSTLLGVGAGADGLVLVPAGSEGYPAGATVAVHKLP